MPNTNGNNNDYDNNNKRSIKPNINRIFGKSVKTDINVCVKIFGCFSFKLENTYTHTHAHVRPYTF